MVFVQVYINNANNGTYFPIPITGKASLRVLGIQYHDGSASANRVLQIQSDNLYFAYSPQRYLTWMCMPTNICQSNISIDMSRDAYHLTDHQFNGQLLLKVVQIFSSDASALPNTFNVILSLDFEMIDLQFN